MHSPFYFIGTHHRPHFSHNSARKEFWNQGISEKTREADAQRSKPSLAQIEAAVQPIIEAMAERFNMSFNFGFRNAEGSIRFAAGPDNRCLPQSPEGCTPTNMSAHTKIPGGSVTKAMTVTRVLQLAEEGLIDLDKAAHLYSDPVTTKLYGWTLAQLWETPAVNKITVRDLMGMTSGLRDYAYMPHSPSPGALYGMHHTTHSRHNACSDGYFHYSSCSSGLSALAIPWCLGRGLLGSSKSSPFHSRRGLPGGVSLSSTNSTSSHLFARLGTQSGAGASSRRVLVGYTSAFIFNFDVFDLRLAYF